MDGWGILLTVSIALFFGGGVGAAIRPKAGYVTSAVASALLLAASIETLVFGPIHGAAWSGPLGDPESLTLNGVSAFFALAASIVWLATSVYSVSYDERSSPLLAICFSITLGSIALLVASASLLLFLIGWETMTIASYGMILQALGRRGRVFSAAFVFLVFGEASTLFVIVAVAGLRVGTGSFVENPYLATGALSTLVFVAALIGFALKMGVAPFHMSEWLPIAHSSAPSNASAVLSSTLTLAGAYGLFRVLSLLGSPPLWWGAVTLGIGAVSVLLGALFAAVSEHTKGLPAYSTIENNGLILVALGIALLARAEGLEGLYVFALFAAFFQALAHAIAKTVLFLVAGSIEHATGTFDLTAIGGGVKVSDPESLAGTLAATLSLAAAPPLAGFVAEWMILESLFQSYQFVPAWVQFLGLVAGAAVALGAGLIVVAMVKFLGFAFLWNPSAAGPGRRSRGLSGPIAAVGAVVLGLGVGAPWILRFLAPAVSSFAGFGVAAPVGGLLDIPNGWSILSGSPFGILSPPIVPITLGAGATVALGYYLLGGRRGAGVRRTPVWMAGSPPGLPGEVYTSFGYSTGLRLMMGSILGTGEIRSSAGTVSAAGIATPVPYSVDLEVLDVFKLFYDDLVRGGEALASALKGSVMTGHLGRYLAYILIVVLGVVIYVAAAGT
ncbi:MAG TPA: proton-conducting transporter membrane subunit [Thermoplasmata archaeon]|nr:proton-conducting transporter membrane subunit [Thermoplasmata archaeon]